MLIRMVGVGAEVASIDASSLASLGSIGRLWCQRPTLPIRPIL